MKHLKEVILIIFSIVFVCGLDAQKRKRPYKMRNQPSLTRTFNNQVRKGYNLKKQGVKHNFNNRSALPKVNKLANRGSTGRTWVKNRVEARALTKLKKNPSHNIKRLITIGSKGKGDPRWRGWTKFQYKVGKGTFIHFNRRLGKDGKFRYDDFKFKNRPNVIIRSKNSMKKKINISNHFHARNSRIGKSPYSQFYQAAKKRSS